MMKIKTIILILTLFACICVKGQHITLYTPNGSQVYATRPSEDYSYSERQIRTSEIISGYNVAVQDLASTTYNCHGYAWSMADGGVTCRINADDVSIFWGDGSYVTCSETEATKIVYYYGDHSAVPSPAGSGLYRSKWGWNGPLVDHDPNIVPASYNPSYRAYYKRATTPPPAPIISGSSSITVGTTQNYTASNMPSNGSWYAATSSIACSPTYGSSTTVSVNNGYTSGTATLQIRVNGSAVASKSITINNSSGGGGSGGTSPCTVPIASNISGNCGLESGTNVYYARANYSGGSTSIIQYQWEPTSSGWTIIEHPNFADPPTMSRVRCTYSSSSPSSCTLRARAQNSCGWSNWQSIGTIGGSSGGGGHYYSAYPNPTSSSLTVEINEALYAQQQEQQTQMMSATADGTTAGATSAKTKAQKTPTFDVRIYDQQGVLLRQQKCKGGTLTFNLSGLRAGVYLLKVDDGSGKAPLTEQIVVER